MPIWLQILCLFLAICFLIILFDMILTFFCCGHAIRDNIIFKNKYERKIYFEKEKIDKIQKKCTYKIIAIEDKIKFYNSKSLYEENIKVLHEI